MKQVLTTCRKCDGTGQVPLDPSLEAALSALSKFPNSTSPHLHAKMFSGGTALSINAINNRLEKLRSMNLVGRRKSGIAWEYSVKKGAMK